MQEALFYKKLPGPVIECFLCNHNCRINENGFGICRARKNIGGKLFSLNYGHIIASNIDPIEKKPLFHFLPASKSYSIACLGCNFSCGFCQNWQISQIAEAQKIGIKSALYPAKNLVEATLAAGCPSISYTYTEPTIYFEYAYECCVLAHKKNVKNVFVSNGYMSKDSLKYIAPLLDGANIDLKSFSEDFYNKICKAELKPVLENIEMIKKLGVWLEITTLLIPGYNDSSKELEKIAKFIVSIDKNIPWHVSKFYPNYQFDSVKSHINDDVFGGAVKIGRDCGLKFVYVGNVPTDNGENTYCSNCTKTLIARKGFWVKENNIKDGKCKFCQEKINGVWR